MSIRPTKSANVLSHVDATGRAAMVNVSAKAITERTARAACEVRISAELARAIRGNAVKKGGVLDVARIAGIQAAKRTGDLIPLCHPLALDHAGVDLTMTKNVIHIVATATTNARTGVEMEALTAAAVAALTVIDMGKAIDKHMVINNLRVIEKRGGRSGEWHE